MSINSHALNVAPSLGSLEEYIYWVNQIPMLTADEEKQFATKFQSDGDLQAARQLILSHLRLVVHTAKNYQGYGLQLADLIQEGTIGLMKAVKRFNPNVGVRLVSFAIHWIKAEIHEFVLRNWRIVKIATTKAQRKLFFNIRRATKKLTWLDSEEVQQVAQNLKVSPKEVRVMEARMSNHDIAFDNSLDDDDDHNTNDPVNYLEAQTPNPADSLEIDNWNATQDDKLHAALKQLDERSCNVLKQRWFAENKATLQELAKKYSVSAERIRQIEQEAMRKIKDLMLR